MSRFILGCASFGNVYSELDFQTCLQLVRHALANHINHFDTSPFYGKSQEILGKIISQLVREGFEPAQFIISTKIGRYGENDFDFSYSKCLESVSKSLKVFDRKYLDIVFCHDIEFAPNLDDIFQITLPTLHQLKLEGKIKKIGISGLPLSVLDYIITKSQIQIDVVLTYCSYTLNYSQLDNYIDKWKQKGCQIIHGGVTALGLLTKQGPPSWHPADEKTKNLCQQIAKKYDNITEIAYNYVDNNSKIDHIMIGPSNLKEFYEYLTWQELKLDPTLVDKVKKLFVDNYIWQETNVEI